MIRKKYSKLIFLQV